MPKAQALRVVERMLAREFCGWAILVLLACEIVLLPFIGHSYDTSVFFTLADYVFFLHAPPSDNWAFGSLPLLVVLLSQLPVLIDPALATLYQTRLFLLKLPSWLADIGTALIIRRRSSNPAYGNYWALRYLLDPAVIFVTVMHGQWDALPNCASVAGIALMLTGRFELAAVALGLGAGTKFYPAAFVPLLYVVALQRDSPKRALTTLALFVVVAGAALAPTFWGRLDYVVHAYAYNSFGPGQGVFTFSLWSLVPSSIGLPARFEQLVAVAIPLMLAAEQLRRVPSDRDVARTALFTAMSIVLLNPGAHPPFYIWIAGPLVLYAALENDGLVSFAGVVLSGAAVLMQFCLEGSDEYFLVSVGAAPSAGLLRCVASNRVLEAIICVAAVVIVLAASDVKLRDRAASFWRIASQAIAIACAAFFLVQMGRAVASTGVRQVSRPYGAVGLHFVALTPAKRSAGRACRLQYDSFGSTAFVATRYASPYTSVSLGYTLLSPERMVVGGQTLEVDSLPSRIESIDLTPFDGAPLRLTREYDVTPYVDPMRKTEIVLETPCNLIPENPLLIYRVNLPAARAAAEGKPLLQRLNVFSARELSQSS